MASRGFDGKVALLLGGRTMVAERVYSATARTLATAELGEPGAGRKKERERGRGGGGSGETKLAEATEKDYISQEPLGLAAGETKS